MSPVPFDEEEPSSGSAANLSIGRLEQRITNVEETQREIKADLRVIRDQMTAIHRDLLERGKPQYGVIAVVVAPGAIGGLWGLAIKPVNDDLARLYSITDKLAIKLEDEVKLIDARKLDRASFDETKAEINGRISELNSRFKRE